MDYSPLIASHVTVVIPQVVCITYIVGSTKHDVYGLVTDYRGDFINVQTGEDTQVIVKNDKGSSAGSVNIFALSDDVWTINLQHVLHIVPVKKRTYQHIVKPNETVMVQCGEWYQQYTNARCNITYEYIRNA